MHPGNMAGINVSIGLYPIVKPDYWGYCHFENVLTPYNIGVTQGHTLFYYKEINIRSPKIVIIGSDGPNMNRCSLHVKFPGIEHGKNGYIRFISKDMFEQNYTPLVEENHDTTSIIVSIPVDKESISGKLIFMQCYAIEASFFDVWEYFNFGMKDVTLYTGTNDTVEFSQHDIEFNPEESAVNVNVTFPEPYARSYLFFYLSFKGYSKNSDITVGYYSNQNRSHSQTVPSILNIPFNIKVESDCWNFEHYWSYDFRNREFINLQPGQNGSIRHEKLNLLSPQNNEEGINSNSKLKAEDTGDKGIYLFSIGLKSDTLEPGIYIFTDKNEIELSDKLNYFSLIPNTWYTWSAGKYSTFNSLDEFLSEPFVLRENFNSFQLSNKRHFKTAP